MSSSARTLMPRDCDTASLHSALTPTGQFTSTEEVIHWLKWMSHSTPVSVKQVPFSELGEWGFAENPLRLRHKSGKFFTVEGIRTTTTFGPVKQWDQPIINQPEIGILGIISKVVEGRRYFLMQGKVEPGNVNGAQLSPTLQATRSNYSRVHGGHTPTYLEYFTNPALARVIVDQLQSEQGSRFLAKRNRNMIVEPYEEVPVGENFRWLTLGQIKELLRLDNVVNMDTRSVISCIPLPVDQVQTQGYWPTSFGASLVESAYRPSRSAFTTRSIINWSTELRCRYERQVSISGLDRLEDWEVTSTDIRHVRGEHFRVIGVQVQIGNREVSRWSQPLLAHPGPGLNGMVTQKIDGVLHFLIRACLYPGSRDMFELGPTVSRSAYQDHFDKPDAPVFLELFRQPSPECLRFSSVQSEEGGRFYHYQNRYVVLEMPTGFVSNLPEGYIWMTLGQIHELLPHGYFNMEARNILACLQLL